MPKKQVRVVDPVAVAEDIFRYHEEAGLSRPRIVCAANRYRYIDNQGHEQIAIVPGPRHFSTTMRRLTQALIYGTPNSDLLEQSTGKWAEIEHEEGFIDQHDNYHCRLVAWVIASTNSQIIRRCGGDGLDGHGLFSENLY